MRVTTIKRKGESSMKNNVCEKSPCLYSNQLTLSCFRVNSSLLQGNNDVFLEENGVNSKQHYPSVDKSFKV